MGLDLGSATRVALAERKGHVVMCYEERASPESQIQDTIE